MTRKDRLSKLRESAIERRNDNEPSGAYIQSLEENAKELYEAQYNTLNDRETVGYLAVMTSHNCPQVNHGGLSWQTYLRCGEECPVCGETESP